MKKTVGLTILSLVIAAAVAFAINTGTANAGGAPAVENWPQWRGPNLDGTSGETGLPTTWSDTENVAWTLELSS